MKRLKAERRRYNRQTLKEIEQSLHPAPFINGVEIVHRHHVRYIYFNPCIDGSVMVSPELRFHRDYVHVHKDGFYQNFSNTFKGFTSCAKGEKE